MGRGDRCDGSTKDVAKAKALLKTGNERLQQIKSGKSPWTTTPGPQVLGYRSQIDAYTHLDTFFRFYNEQRPHSAFGMADPKTPMEVYRQPVALAINL